MSRTPGWEVLFVGATLNGNVEGVRRALALGMPVNQLVLDRETYTPLHYAVDRGTRPGVAEALLAAGADVNARAAGQPREGRTPLMLAAGRGRLDLVRLLLAAGADVHALDVWGFSALASACLGGKTAAYEGVVRELLAAGAKPDALALANAASSGSLAMVRMLVAAGADVNAVSRFGTALHQAAD